MNYRAEIDGLRAIAVLPVIFFHAGFKPFSGGFVGVDIFYVISGYLITSILISEHRTGSFSLASFYERRARRILPALFFVIFVSIPFAWIWRTRFWMAPSDFKEFAQSLVAVSTFSSNIFFYLKTGYFDTASELKPFLHTWSLAVEEQYYVIFPVLLLLVWRLGERWLTPILAAIAIVSLALAQWGSQNAPDANFYLLPSRAWELMIGATIASYQMSNTVDETIRPNIFRNLLGIVGLLLIMASVLFFDRTMPFPSLYALAPTVGAALIISFSNSETIVGKILGSRALVGIGLLSYSAYLWHQPLFAFAKRIFDTGSLSETALAGLSGASFALAYFSWKFVEVPFRNKNNFPRKEIFMFAATASVATIAFGLFGHFSKGFASAMTAQQKAILDYVDYNHADLYKEKSCLLLPTQSYSEFASDCRGSPNEQIHLLIWGDSHAAALSPGFRFFVPAVAQYTAMGCPPVIETEIADRPHCRAINDFVLGEVSRIKPDEIILNARWNFYQSQSINFMTELSKTIGEIKRLSPLSKIYLVGGLPQWSPSLPVYMLRESKSLDGESCLNAPLLPDLRATDEQIYDVAATNRVSVLSILDKRCHLAQCRIIDKLDGKKFLSTWDYAHLTEAASRSLAAILLKQMSEASNSVDDPCR